MFLRGSSRSKKTGALLVYVRHFVVFNASTNGITSRREPLLRCVLTTHAKLDYPK